MKIILSPAKKMKVDTHEKDITEEAKPVQEIKEKMASKTLEMPKQEPKKIKVEQPAFDEQEADEEEPPF